MDSLDISLIPPEHEQSDFTAFKPILDLTSGSLSYAGTAAQGFGNNHNNNNSHNSFQRKASPESSILNGPPGRVPAAGYSMNLLPPTSGNAQLPPSFKRENSLNSKKNRQPIFKGGQAGSRNASPNDGNRRNNFMDPITASPASGESFTVNPGVKQNSFLPQNGIGKYDTHFTDQNNESFISTGSYGVPQIEQASRPFSVKQISETPITERYQTVSSNEKETHRSIGSETQECSVNNRSRADGRAMEGSVNRVGSTSSVRRHFPAAGSPVAVKKEVLYKASDMAKLKLESSRRIESEKEGLKVEMVQYAQNYFAGLKADIQANSTKADELQKAIQNYSNPQDKALESKISRLQMDQQQLKEAANSLAKDVRISLQGQLENIVAKVVEGAAISDMEKKLESLNTDLEGRIDRINENLELVQKDKLKGQSKSAEDNAKLLGNLRKELADKASKSDVDGVLSQRSAELWSRLGEIKAESKRIESLAVKNDFLEKKISELSILKSREEQSAQAKLRETQLKEDLRRLTSFHAELKEEMEEFKLSKEMKMQAMEDRLSQINQKILLKSQLSADPKSTQKVNNSKVEELNSKIAELKMKMNELKQQSYSKFEVLKNDQTLRVKTEQNQLLQAEREKFSQEKLILQQERERFDEEKAMFFRNVLVKIKSSPAGKQINQQFPSANVANHRSSENSDFKQSQQLQNYHEFSPEQSDQSIPHPLLHHVAPYFNNPNPLERQLLQPPSPQFDALFRSTSNKQYFLATQPGSSSALPSSTSSQQPLEIQKQLSPRPSKSDGPQNQRNTTLMQATTPNRDSDPINFSAVDIFTQKIASKDSSFNTSAAYTPLSNNNNNYNNNINDLHNIHNQINNNTVQHNINNSEAINSILRSQAKQQQYLPGVEQSNASQKMENPFNACVYQSNQNNNNFFDQNTFKSQQIQNKDNVANSKAAGTSATANNVLPVTNSKLSPQQNDNILHSKKAIEDQDFEIILKANNVHTHSLKQSSNQNQIMNSQHMEDFLDQLDDFNENNIELVSENNEDQYYESDEPEDEEEQQQYEQQKQNSHKKRHNQAQHDEQNDASEEQDNHKKYFSGLNNQLDIPLIQIAEEDNEEESHLGISVSPLTGQQESLICTKSNSIEQITQAKTQQNRLKITQQIAGLLQSLGKQRIACTRDEVGYLKDANGFYIFDSEGRMIKTDKDTFNELLALELVQQV